MKAMMGTLRKEAVVNVNALKLTMGFQKRLAHMFTFGLVNKEASLSQHQAKQEANTWYKSTIMWKTPCLSHWETHDNPPASKTTSITI